MNTKPNMYIFLALSYYQVRAKLNQLFTKAFSKKQVNPTLTKQEAMHDYDHPHHQRPEWQALKTASFNSALKQDTFLYSQLVQDFDNKLKLIDCEKVSFIGKGVGDSSLNSYRKLSLSNQILFEKIYLKNAKDLARLNWFYEHIHHHLRSLNIYTPNLVKKQCGKHACALYFEFIDAPLDNHPNFLPPAIYASLKLSQLRVSEQHSSPNFHDFRQHAFYQASKRIAQKWLSEQGKNNFNFDNYEQKLAALPKWPAHGDLHGKNLGKPNIVIDWDNCGLYPLGFDIAVSMSKSLQLANHAHLRYFLKHKIKPFVDTKEWPAFEQSIYFFLFVFYAGRIGKKITFKTWQALVLNLKP